MRAINVIASCTALKRHTPKASQSMASISTKKTSTRFENWKACIERLENRIPAKDLYKGGYWSTMTSLTQPNGESKPQLWVLSAGFGFIRATEPVTPYSATFSRNQPDSVIHPEAHADDILDWWSRLIEWNSSKKRGPASIEQLATKHPNTPIVAAISPNYLRAAQEDLCAAREALSDPTLLIIISTGTKSHKRLADNLIPVDARFQHVVGGSRTSLNARITQWILSNTKHDQLRADKVSRKVSRLLTKQPNIPTYNRDIMSDKEVGKFIRKHLKTHARPSHSRFLTMLREEGKACEQKRFRQIYFDTTN
jgi:hypothetical protein